MIPGLLANEVASALREFIITGFESETAPFSGEFRRLVEEQQDGQAFLKGPYVTVGLPFKPGSAGTDFFADFATQFPPFAHQQQAWQRLASDRRAANTLVATGTGSGKTECFLYPILDHCRRATKPGIKAIVIYPMNALATDQAKRFAQIIHQQPVLKGLRVGLFVGGDGQGTQVMTPELVITDKETLRANPPDVLLTNYKMLDYLLMRPKDQKLWAHNGSETLRYLVVDELHTFDGAQGTDLSLLIRRLRARFSLAPEKLICVGTSATLGGDDSVTGLLSYAADIFSSPFRRDSVITEQRVDEADFLDNIAYLNLNQSIGPEVLADALKKGLGDYLNTAYELYFSRAPDENLESTSGRIALGRSLKQHGQLANLLRQFKRGKGTPTLTDLVESLAGQLPSHFARNPATALLALFSLLAHARAETGQPFVQLRLQLWSRELRRIVGTLREPVTDANAEQSEQIEQLAPLLSFGDDKPKKEQELVRLPLVQCRECHGTAWLTRMEGGPVADAVIETDLSLIYPAFFGKHEETALLLPWQEDRGLSSGGHALEHFRVCRACGKTARMDHGETCPRCQAEKKDLIRLSRPRMLKQVTSGGVNRVIHEHDCPYCAARSALVVFGARAASLSAVAIHQLFSSRDNDDRKLLTFSDSVQDATHRAGFFAARTWHNNMRMALTQLLESGGGSITLLDLPSRFEAYWLGRGGDSGRLSLPFYLREFMPPDRRYRADFEQFEQSGSVSDPLPLLKLIRDRVLWQALEDLSWRSRVGRSLQRLGVAALDWQQDDIEKAAAAWADTVDNQLGYRITADQAFGFMVGLIQHLVGIGAIGLDDLRRYREKSGKAYFLSFLDYTPRLGPGSPRPTYPAEGTGEGFEALDGGRGQSWYARWLACLNTDTLVDKQQLVKVLVAALDALCDVNLAITEFSERGVRLWALRPEALSITTDVMVVDCSGHAPLHVAASHTDAWIGLPLMSATGAEQVYERSLPVRESLYRNLYRRGEIHRVIAHEHTGLLPPSERLRVEASFLDGKKPWEYNLLSATPTLEMGIDIGSLSSVLLCSVPPAQANYLQRVGRGGRRDGNAFVLTVANGRPHDLVFYADPGRMLDTPVEPPAVFLKARHVLRRQLLAYIMDCWTAATRGDNQIPATMQPVLDAVEKTKEDSFPYTLINYLKHNMQELWDGFVEFIATELGADDQELLRQYLFGGPQHPDDHLPLYVLGRLKRVADERRTMGDAVKQLDKAITGLRKQPQDEHRDAEIAELERESAGYRSLRVRLNRRETLNFFTDEGLLPNYAFPEEGATLHSVIFRSERLTTADGAEREYIKREYEYQRPAQAALTELAPDAVFYAGDRRVSVSRVETARGRNILDWRFCPRCHFSASGEDPTSGFSDPVCPRCQTVQWSDESARTKMLKMTQVYAFTSAKEAQLSDTSDDREPEFFNKQMLIDFEPSDIAITWVLSDDNRPFGFEFLRSARFLEVNFGRRDGEDLFFDVAGEHLQRSGFAICRECGSVQPRRGEAKHLKGCGFSRGPKKLAGGQEDNGIENCLYLYREFVSEGLRILLPRLATGGTEEQVNSFVAALQLGLKRRFGGKVDHLSVAYQSEPLGSGDDRRHFVVLYDSVPGGTGYLHELLSKAEHMQDVFQLAYDVMMGCDCYEHSMDGCYRCLLQYRNAYGMESTRKSVALEMLREIVEGDYEWIQQAQSLSTLNANPWVDSELESRFPEAVATFSGADCVNQKKVRVIKDVVRGKIGSRVNIGDTAYDMEPQVDLGAVEGVQFASRADFVLWPVHAGNRAVVIFLDGYQYHDKSSSQDLLKRQSLMRAGFVVWSLNWYDVNQVLGDKAMDVPLPTGMTASTYHHQAVTQLAQKAGVSNFAEHASKTSFELLMCFLVQQDSTALAHQALFFAFQCLPATSFADPHARERVLDSLAGLPVAFSDMQPQDPVLAAEVQIQDAKNSAAVSLNLMAGRKLLQDFDLKSVMVTLCYDLKAGEEKVALYQWQRFWGSVNFLQFLPLFYAYTPQSKHDGTAAGLEWPSEEPRAEKGAVQAGELAWYELLDQELSESLREIDVVWPEEPQVGEDVLNAEDEVIGNAELIFTSAKIVFLTQEAVQLQSWLESEGWRVCLSIEELYLAINNKNEGT